MKNSILILVIALALVGCESKSGRLAKIKAKRAAIEKSFDSIDSKHNVFIRFNGTDKQIPKDGELLIIKCSLEDTIIVEPASIDDARAYLENNGRG